MRFLRFVARNWPLKVGAIALSTLLYGGLVLSQTTKEFPGSVPIETVNQASDVIVLSDLGTASQVRYVAPGDLGLRVDSASFRATVDLGGVDPKGGPVSLTVRVTAVDPRVQVLDYQPRRIVVTLDRVSHKTVPVRAVLGTLPAGLTVGDPIIDQATSVVTGPESLLGKVTETQARVSIDPSGIDINRMIDLVAVDAGGDPVIPIDVTPASVLVRVPVFTDRRTRTVPVSPVIIGTPAAGFEVASVTVDPVVVQVEGDANDLAGLDRADTVAVSVTGLSADLTTSVVLQLPSGVQALGPGTVSVTVRLRALTGTRTFDAGLILVEARADLVYKLSTDRVLVVIGGSEADLDRLSGATLALTVNVTGLAVGSHQVTPTANLTTGLSLLRVSPSPIIVTISPAPSPTP
ncbi:MAG TPA: CdaR family protein [Candidatus Limnocylindrales bacterium]|nr:CdaR family protein [Candidatus Limnocylindrales bacterium]